MGYRHIMVSETMAPRRELLPDWFVEKYSDSIDFGGAYWRSYGEFKMYTTWEDLEEDVAKVVTELQPTDPLLECIRLVFFADESPADYPDIIHLAIYPSGSKRIEMT